MNRISIFNYLFILLISCFSLIQTRAQDSLPVFEVQERNGMVIIGWKNPYPELTQLVIQRSYDSTKGFKSIMAMPDPSSVSNGYVDKTINAVNQYYRLFYVQPGGRYFFTASVKPRRSEPQIEKVNPQPENVFEKVYEVLPVASLNKKDKLNKIAPTSTLESTLPENLFTPSTLIFSNKDGDLIVALPEANQKKYLLKVYRENGLAVFTMKDIKDPQLLVDRSNFYHSGWFTFELYEGGKIKEKNKFFIPSID
ncbi:MAG: hypothetical protein ACK5AO_09115 [bacterium]